MAAEDWHLAQVNVARFLEPIDAPRNAGFVERLAPVNAVADAAPGFVWRLQTEQGDATAIHAFDDELILVNLSVWRSIEAFADFVFGADHAAVLRRRREWTEPMDQAYVALWWVPAGQIPTVAEAKRRLSILRERGPSPEAFTLRERFPAPADVGASLRLSTERLELRPLVPQDLDALEPVLVDLLGMTDWPRERSIAETRSWIERNVARYAADGFGRCAVVWRETSELVADAGLISTVVEETAEIELGWVVRADMRGRGIATEAGAAWRDFAFEVLGLPRIVSMIEEGNAASRRVAQRLGMSLERPAMWGEDLMLMYALGRA